MNRKIKKFCEDSKNKIENPLKNLLDFWRLLLKRHKAEVLKRKRIKP